MDFAEGWPNGSVKKLQEVSLFPRYIMHAETTICKWRQEFCPTEHMKYPVSIWSHNNKTTFRKKFHSYN